MHPGVPPPGADVLALGVAELDVEGLAVSERCVRQLDVGEEEALVEQRGAHAGAQRHDVLEAGARHDGAALDIGIVGEEQGLSERLDEGLLEGIALPEVRLLLDPRAARLHAREGRDRDDMPPSDQAGEPDGDPVVAGEGLHQLEQLLEEQLRAARVRRLDAHPLDEHVPLRPEHGRLEAGATDVDGEGLDRTWPAGGDLHACQPRAGRGRGQASVRISAPVSVTTRVCSNCADRLRSRVTTVHPSGQMS